MIDKVLHKFFTTTEDLLPVEYSKLDEYISKLSLRVNQDKEIAKNISQELWLKLIVRRSSGPIKKEIDSSQIEGYIINALKYQNINRVREEKEKKELSLDPLDFGDSNRNLNDGSESVTEIESKDSICFKLYENPIHSRIFRWGNWRKSSFSLFGNADFQPKTHNVEGEMTIIQRLNRWKAWEKAEKCNNSPSL